MTASAPEVPTIRVGEVRNVKVDMQSALDAGELMTGTPTVAELVTSDLTVDNAAVNAGAVTIKGVSVAAGLALQCRVDATSAVAGTVYRLQFTATTDATLAQTIKPEVHLAVV